VFNYFDRLKLVIPYNNNTKLDSLFSKQFSPDLRVLTVEKYKSTGVRIYINHIRKEMHLDFSAKILGINYTENISILNIREGYSEINKIIKITPKQFYSSTPYYCENVSDIHIV
jgi:hypothetical protein